MYWNEYSWDPKEDITAYELALCLPVFLMSKNMWDWGNLVMSLPDNARRHFTATEIDVSTGKPTRQTVRIGSKANDGKV